MSAPRPDSTSSNFSITVPGSTDVPDRSVVIDDQDFGSHVFEVDAIKKLDPGDELVVNVGADTSAEYQVEVFDRELNTALFKTPTTGDGSFTFGSSETSGLDTGSFVIAVMVDNDPRAVFPLVARAYGVSVRETLAGIQTCGNLTVTADLTDLGSGAPISRVQLSIMSTDSTTAGSVAMEEIEPNVYQGTIDDLGENEYWHGVAVAGDESTNFDVQGFSFDGKEAIGFSEIGNLTVELPASEKLDQRWKATRDDRLQYSTVAVDTAAAYMGGLESTVEARVRNTGDVEWTKTRDGELSDSSPVVHYGTIYIGSGGGVLYALDADTGSVDFSVTLDSAITSTPVVMDGTVYFATNDGRVLAVDTGSSGDTNPTASVSVGDAIYSDLAAGGGQVYATTVGGDVVALPSDLAGEAWRHSTGVELTGSSPTYHDGSVYVAADAVYAYDAASGSERWSFTAFGGTAGSDPTVYGDIVYVGDADGTVYGLNDTDGGSQLWTAQTGDAVAATPAVDSGQVIVASMDGSVYVFDRTTGSTTWSTAIGEAMRSSPTVDSDEVYVGTEQGNVYALENLPEFEPNATPVTVIDSFEHRDVTNNGWSTVASGGQDWTYSSAFLGCGDVSLALSGNSFRRIASYPGDGLSAYPQQGDVLKYEWQTTITPGGGDGQLRLYFAADQNDDVYRLDMDIGDDKVALYDRLDNRQIDVVTGVGLQADTHYSTTLEWDDGNTFGGAAGDMTVRVVDLETGSTVARLSGNDAARSQGGIEIMHATNSAGDTIYSDYYRILNR